MIKMLVVDDEAIVRKGIRYSIDWNQYGIDIIDEVSNGQAALEKIAEHSPDIILTDIRMPVMDGLELAKRIKDIDSHIKIVILSGYEEFQYAQQAIRIGVSEYLLKPVREETLIELVIRLKGEIEKDTAVKVDNDVPQTFININLLKNQDRRYNSIVRNAIKYMEDNYDKNITLSDISVKTFVSPNYLSTVFKEEVGINYVDWLNRHRIEKAAYYLKETNLKVYEIAGKVGFTDYKYFCSVFKRFLQCTPKQYREL